MKLPSVQQITSEAAKTLRRFPLVLLCALIGVISALMIAESDGPPEPSLFFKSLLAAALGLPLLIALAVLAEKRRFDRVSSFLLQGLGVVLLVGYGLTVPSELPIAPEAHLSRFFLLNVALHLIVAGLPFLGRSGTVNGFWQFNKALFMRCFTTALFSLALYAGLAIALAALDNLFGVDVPGKRYLELFILIAGLFATSFFLAGIPDDLDALDSRDDYPKFIKIFAQYILLPIVVVYLIILYAYLGKIVFSWNWPKGWVSGLITGFATTGIFSLLLLHPIRDRLENLWLRRTWRWFYVVLGPLIVMLLLAVLRRVSDYGITEGRYFACALAVWLAFIAMYFSTGVSRSIKTIPVSLAVAALLVSVGPWGAFSVSEHSQIARLRAMLEQEKLMESGIIRPATTALSRNSAREISAMLSYLHGMHGYDGIRAWFPKKIADSLEIHGVRAEPSQVARMLGLEYDNSWRWGSGEYFSYGLRKNSVLDVKGYHRMVQIDAGDFKEELVFTDSVLKVTVYRQRDTIVVVAREAVGTHDSLVIPIRAFVDSLVTRFGNTGADNVPAEQFTLSAGTMHQDVKIVFSHIALHREDKAIRIQDFSAMLLQASR
jgi:hypothetical protein